ncbi:MAG TPA: S41 family peptidase [Pyrinomonadaceae bacterium]|nr:S41 family peptidase [Pyrinomonadaceae bacterium]
MKSSNFFAPPNVRRSSCALVLAALAVAFVSTPRAAHAQQTPQFGDRQRGDGREMLKTIKEGIEKNYYDSKFHGLDLDARFKAAEEKIKQANSNNEIFGHIAAAMADLNDSHTYFLPPWRPALVDYGWRMQMVGDKCYVVDVAPGSDAAGKGLRVGDEVLAIDGYQPTRENFWKIRYVYYTLKPRAGMRLEVSSPAGEARQLDVLGKVASAGSPFAKASKKESAPPPPNHLSLGDLFVWKLAGFRAGEKEMKEIDEVMKKARGHRAFVLDLRGNSGGAEKALLRLTGYFFGQDVKLGDIKRRKGAKELVAKTRGAEQVYGGQLFVLVDSRSASASEVFARVVQLEKRGTIIGDRTAGAVMRGRVFGYTIARGLVGTMTFIPYGAVITDADLTMKDGKSLEKTGVTPDELLLPTATDLAARLDPVLSRAASLAGVALEPARAGALFKAESKTQNDEPDADEGDEEDEEKEKEGKKPL